MSIACTEPPKVAKTSESSRLFSYRVPLIRVLQVLVERCALLAASREEERRARIEQELGLVGEEEGEANRNNTEEQEDSEEESNDT